MALSSDQRKNVRFLLLMIILLTIPCYCLGLVVLQLSDKVEQIEQFPQDTPPSGNDLLLSPVAFTPTEPRIVINPTDRQEDATATLTLTATLTRTFFLTWTRTPTNTATATLTPTNTLTPSVTPSETPTETPQPTSTQTPLPSNTPLPTETETSVELMEAWNGLQA